MKNELFLKQLPLHTNRLLITKTTINDIDLLLKMDKQEETQMYLGGIKNKSKEERIEFLRKKEQKNNKGISSSLTVYLDKTPIGFVGLKIDEESNSGEISYIFDIDYTKKGYATEVVEKIIEIAFLKVGLTKIFADTVEKNISSSKLLLKLGFEQIGKREADGVIFNEFEKYNNVDLVIVGNLSIDKTYFHKKDGIAKTDDVGGAALYSSMPASLYTRVGIVSKVGDNFNLEVFNKYPNIDTRGLQIIKGEPSTEFITHYYDETNHKKRDMEEHINERLEIKPEDFPKEYLNAKYIHFATNYPHKQKELIEYIRKNSNATISVDTIEQYSKDKTLPEVFSSVDIAFIDDDFINLLDTTAKTRIIKKGKYGCTLKENRKEIDIPTIPNDNVVDKTGAGDCFNAVFLANLVLGKDKEEALKEAVKIATYSINFYGLENIYKYKEIKENLQ